MLFLSCFFFHVSHEKHEDGCLSKSVHFLKIVAMKVFEYSKTICY